MVHVACVVFEQFMRYALKKTVIFYTKPRDPELLVSSIMLFFTGLVT